MIAAPFSRNGAGPSTPRGLAELYLARGLAVIDLPPRSKAPGRADWQHERLTLGDLDLRFPVGSPRNVAVLNGAPSGNAIDADLDCPEAIVAAPLFLPPTGWVFGRAGKRSSHRIYHTDLPLDTAQLEFTDLDGTMLLELRGTGGITVYPGSTHEDTGMPIEW